MNAVTALHGEEISQDRESVAVITVLHGSLEGVSEFSGTQVLLDGQRLAVVAAGRGRDGVGGLPHDVRKVARNPEEVL
ncbi:hypothetical protein D3C73_1552990 [compost metagenome]